MTPHETSEQLGLTPEQLRTARERNTGPEFYTLSPRLIRYNRADVLRRTTGDAPCSRP